eukprot:TRINITY_DN18423_c0_g1_i1.p1 TRINITY_DN18423_c0_g1~~TRINITY_DN18423_c0_g1_i1.p1  ORF type:complete len:558 (+),score=47.38 TRINITY_DN18423_c0_g1_i1:30-1676(+)
MAFCFGNFSLFLALIDAVCISAVVLRYSHHPLTYSDVAVVGFIPSTDLGTGRATVSFNLDISFKRSAKASENATGYIQVIVFDYKRAAAGIWHGKELGTPCAPASTADELASGAAERKGIGIITGTPLLFGWEATLGDGEHTPLQVGPLAVPNDGLFVTYIVSCQYYRDSTDTTNVQLNPYSQYLLDGTITYYNKWGHLPGQLFGVLPYFATLCAILAIAVGTWVLAIIGGSNRIVAPHAYIAFVFGCSLLECLALFWMYFGYNESGEDSATAWGIASAAQLLRRLVTRVLVLLAATGHGVLCPQVGLSFEEQRAASRQLLPSPGPSGPGFAVPRITAFAIAYVVLGAIAVGADALRLKLASQLLLMAVTALDGVVYFALVTLIRRTLSLLGDAGRRTRRNSRRNSRVMLYRNLGRIIAINLVISISWLAWTIVQEIVPSVYFSTWRVMWLYSEFWAGLHVCMLSLVAWTWRPSHPAFGTRQAHSFSSPLQQEELAMLALAQVPVLALPAPPEATGLDFVFTHEPVHTHPLYSALPAVCDGRPVSRNC